VSAVESALERKMATAIMHGGAQPAIRTLEAGEALITQGEASTEVYLVLDGVFLVKVDDRELAEIGPGAVVGERAGREGGTRTATVLATTRARVAEASPDVLGALELDTLAESHRREGEPG
jgi:CRP-like cAMP-binding protein